MARLIIISWRDIPAQVVCKRGRETAKIQLSARFQEAVDRAAMRAGKGSSDAYLADWKRSEPQPCGDDIQAVVAATAAQIEARFTDEDLERLIKAKGLLAPSADASGDAGGPTEPDDPEGPAGPAGPPGA
jgi:Virulence factor